MERPILFSDAMVRAIVEGRKTQTRLPLKPLPDETEGRFEVRGSILLQRNSEYQTSWSCPYGVTGDRLWVREAWTVPGAVPRSDDPVKPGMRVLYRADGSGPAHTAWRPSIHMPRWASRLLLEITGVRVERLHEISETDAKAEGVQPLKMVDGHFWAFRDLWDAINGDRAPWPSNPWVWVIGFRKL